MLKTLRQFPATFYVANVMEIFERMAWYGFYALAALYISGPREEGCLGIPDTQRGLILGVIPFLLYLFPVVTGALADKFGYKKTFFIAYAILTPGYLLLGQARGAISFFFAFLLVAVGAALFKPVVTGTVARVTSEATKAMGFGIFYMIVNVGGFLGPLVATIIRGYGWPYIFVMSSIWIGLNFIPLLTLYKEPGKDDEAEEEEETFGERMVRVWRDMTEVLGNGRFFVFVAVLLVLLMIAGGGLIPMGGVQAWLAHRGVALSELATTWAAFGVVALIWTAINLVVDRTVRDKGAKRAEGAPEPFWTPMRLGDWRFGLYLLIISGFWTEFNQIFITMPLYIQDYVDTVVIQDGVRAAFAAIPALGPSLVEFWNWALGFIAEDGQIKPENLINLDALAIVFFQVLVTWGFAKWKPFTTMVVGTLVTGVSMLMGIYAAELAWVTIFAILVFSIGEMMASPKSQEYVARIAPKGKEAMYMGYYFVSIALGNLFGGLLSGQAYAAFANRETGNGHPEHMWMLFAGIAVASALAMWSFNRFITPREPTKN